MELPSAMRFMRSSMPASHACIKRARWLRAAAAITLCAMALLLPGCWVIPPKVLTTPDNPVFVGKHFPSALLAEPIQLRKGYTNATQPFTIKSRKERWAIAIGFVRSDADRPIEEKMDEGYDVCWVRSPGDGIGSTSCSKNIGPGFSVGWELLREDGSVVAQFELDSLRQDSGGTFSTNAITRTLGGFRDQLPGQYRLRVTIMRDAKELDFLKPHILVDRPFFSSRAVE